MGRHGQGARMTVEELSLGNQKDETKSRIKPRGLYLEFRSLSQQV